MERREFLSLGSAALLAAALPLSLSAKEAAAKLPFEVAYKEAIKGARKVIKNAKQMKLNIPDEPENGLVVPVEVEIDYPMEEKRYIKQITVLTTKNKVNRVVRANYTSQRQGLPLRQRQAWRHPRGGGAGQNQ